MTMCERKINLQGLLVHQSLAERNVSAALEKENVCEGKRREMSVHCLASYYTAQALICIPLQLMLSRMIVVGMLVATMMVMMMVMMVIMVMMMVMMMLAAMMCLPWPLCIPDNFHHNAYLVHTLTATPPHQQCATTWKKNIVNIQQYPAVVEHSHKIEERIVFIQLACGCENGEAWLRMIENGAFLLPWLISKCSRD